MQHGYDVAELSLRHQKTAVLGAKVEIAVELLTEDGRLADICKRYWELGDHRNFVYSTRELARECGGPSALYDVIRKGCTAKVLSHHCCDCGKEQSITVEKRTEFHRLGGLCPSCEKQRYAREEKQEADALYENEERTRERDEFLSGRRSSQKRRQTFAGRAVTMQPGKYAAVHVEMGDSSQVIRFVNVSEYEFHFEGVQAAASDGGESAPAEQPAQGTLLLKGAVELGGCSNPISSDASHYLVSVGSDGSFTIHRVQPQSSGRSAAVLISEQYAGGGFSIQNELEKELIEAITEDFEQKQKERRDN